MLHDLIQIRNKLQPHSSSNSDSLQFDYNFWSDLEKIAKKHREAAKANLLILAGAKATKPGIIVRGVMFETTLKQTAPIRTFDKEVFIDHIVTNFPDVPRHSLRELATKSLVDGEPRRTYTVSAVKKDD